MRPGLRHAAKAAGLTRYWSDRPCPRGHVGERWTLTYMCVECYRQRQAAAYAANADHRKARVKAWAQANPEQAGKNKAAWKARNTDKLHRGAAEYRASHPDVIARNAAARRAAKRNARPPWVSPGDLSAVFALAATLSRETGIKHSVDHIVPLTHPLVCGLHVPWNLRVIPLRDNLRKGNSFRAEP